MSFKLLDTVVLDRDLPDQGLMRGDLGAVVDVYGDGGLEVEFVTGAGETRALITLHVTDVRAVDEGDLISARSRDFASRRTSFASPPRDPPRHRL